MTRSAACPASWRRRLRIICLIATGTPARGRRDGASDWRAVKRVAYPENIFCQRAAAPFLLCRHAEPRCQKTRGADRVVELDAVAIEPASDSRLIDRERGLEHRLARNGEHKIAGVMMAVGPGGAVVVEYAANVVGGRIDREIVQPNIAVDQHAVGRIDRQPLVGVESAADGANERHVVDDPDESRPD